MLTVLLKNRCECENEESRETKTPVRWNSPKDGFEFGFSKSSFWAMFAQP